MTNRTNYLAFNIVEAIQMVDAVINEWGRPSQFDWFDYLKLID